MSLLHLKCILSIKASRDESTDNIQTGISRDGNPVFPPLMETEYNFINLLKQDTVTNESLELQMMLADFFRELKQLNKYMSIVVPFAVISWIATNAVLSIVGLQFNTSGRYIVRGIHSIGLVIISILSYNALGVPVKTAPAYAIINSIAAIDSTHNKHYWLFLLNSYTARPCYAFTILYTTKIFTRLALLQVFAYTISIIFIVEDFQHW